MKTLLLSLGLLFLIGAGCASAQQTQPIDPPVYRGGYTPIDAYKREVRVKKNEVRWGKLFGFWPWSVTTKTEYWSRRYDPGVMVKRSTTRTSYPLIR